MTKDPGADRAVGKLFGALLMAVGGLIAGLAGLCSAAFLVSILATDTGGGAAWIVLAVGGAPVVVGVLIFLGGRKLWRG